MSDASKQRRYLARGQVAKRFGITTRTVRRWEQRPELDFPTVIIMNGRGYFEEQQIEDYERRLVRATASRHGTLERAEVSACA